MNVNEYLQKRYESFKKSINTVSPYRRQQLLRFLLKNDLYSKYIENYINDYDNVYVKKLGDRNYCNARGWTINDIIALSFTWSNTTEGFSIWDRMNRLFRQLMENKQYGKNGINL